MKRHELKNLLTALGCPSLTEDETNQILQKIYSLLQEQKFHKARQLLKDPNLVEDALNETLWKIYKGISSYRGEGTGWGWVNKILKNECLRFGDVRAKKRKAKESVRHIEIEYWEQNLRGDEFGRDSEYGPHGR